VIDGSSFAVEPGRMLVLLGPNGSEKTSRLRLLAGLKRPCPTRSRSTARTSGGAGLSTRRLH